MHGGQQHGRVFARAVVVKLSEGLACGFKAFRGVGVVRSVSTTFESGRVAPRAGEHRGYRLGVNRFAFVRSAGDGKLAIADIEVISRAAGDKRNRLNRLDSRARGSDETVIAEALYDLLVGYGDHD